MKNTILSTLLLFSIINLHAQDSIATKLDPGKVRGLFPSKPTVELIESYNIPNQQAVFMKTFMNGKTEKWIKDPGL